MCLGIPGEIVAIEQPAEQGALLQGVVSFGGVRKLEDGRAEVENQYSRLVRAHGNLAARAAIEPK